MPEQDKKYVKLPLRGATVEEIDQEWAKKTSKKGNDYNLVNIRNGSIEIKAVPDIYIQGRKMEDGKVVSDGFLNLEAERTYKVEKYVFQEKKWEKDEMTGSTLKGAFENINKRRAEKESKFEPKKDKNEPEL